MLIYSGMCFVNRACGFTTTLTICLEAAFGSVSFGFYPELDVGA